MYQFDHTIRELLEKQEMALAVYQVVDRKVVTVLVSDGFCKMRSDTREHLTSALDSSMFDRVDERDAGMLAQKGKEFANHEAPYDVFYHVGGANEVMKLIHTVGFWQTMDDGTELAFLYYTDLTKSAKHIEESTKQYLEFREDHFYIDPLTKLPNLNYLHEFGDERINAIRLSQKEPLCIYFSVPAMQNYNNQYGYEAGDNLLCLIAGYLRKYYPDALIARGYGDCFIVITENHHATQLIDSLNRDIIRNAKGNTSGLKAGLCELTFADTIITALNHAKLSLKMMGYDVNKQYALYSSKIDQDYFQQRYIVDYFEQALTNHQITVFYQGIVESVHKKARYCEALARWIDPNQGMISPGEFIPVLRKYHLMYKLDLYMVEQVCKEYVERKEKGYTLVPVSINLSAQDFDHANMFQEITKLLEKYDVPTEKLIIEITEEDLAMAEKNFQDQLDGLRNYGFHVWVDDFGSGYSNLSVFSRYQCHLIKIDQTLMRSLTPANKIIIKAIIQMAKELGIQTLCEGVETEEQYQFAKEAEIDYIQGFYFFKPTSLTVLEHERTSHPDADIFEKIMAHKD